jgi:hypothetical protein
LLTFSMIIINIFFNKVQTNRSLQHTFEGSYEMLFPEGVDTKPRGFFYILLRLYYFYPLAKGVIL